MPKEVASKHKFLGFNLQPMLDGYKHKEKYEIPQSLFTNFSIITEKWTPKRLQRVEPSINLSR
jgi:hypothetical protein